MCRTSLPLFAFGWQRQSSLTDLSHRTVSPLNANGVDFAVDDKISIYKVNIAKNLQVSHVELILGRPGNMGLCKITTEQCHQFALLSNQRKRANGAQMISLASCWHFSGVRAGARPRRHHRHQFVGRPPGGWSGISHTARYRPSGKRPFSKHEELNSRSK